MATFEWNAAHAREMRFSSSGGHPPGTDSERREVILRLKGATSSNNFGQELVGPEMHLVPRDPKLMRLYGSIKPPFQTAPRGAEEKVSETPIWRNKGSPTSSHALLDKRAAERPTYDHEAEKSPTRRTRKNHVMVTGPSAWCVELPAQRRYSTKCRDKTIHTSSTSRPQGRTSSNVGLSAVARCGRARMHNTSQQGTSGDHTHTQAWTSRSPPLAASNFIAQDACQHAKPDSCMQIMTRHDGD